MQCQAPCGKIGDFTCLTQANYPNPHTAEWKDNENKPGLLGIGSTVNNNNKWMTFEQLKNPNDRRIWLNNAYPAMITAGIIPNIPNLNNVSGNLQGPVDLTPYITKVSSFQSKLNDEYCYYQLRYYAAVNMFLNNYKDASQASNVQLVKQLQDSALICNNKVNTLIAWMNYLAEKQILNLGTYQNQITQFDQNIKNTSEQLTKQAQILQDNSNSSQLYQEMVKFTTEKNQAHQNLLALYFTLNVVAIASLFVLARVL
jgi:hypothetical protein